MGINRENEELLRTLKLGDLLKFDRGYYEDWAVYIGQEKGHEKVMYWWTGKRSDVQTRLAKTIRSIARFCKFRNDEIMDYIRIGSYREVAGTSKAEKGNEENREDEKNGTIDGSKVVEGAKAFKDRIEQEDASGLFENCEHFAKWCRYGPLRHKSTEEISDLKDIQNFIEPKPKNNNADGKTVERNRVLLLTLKEGDLLKFNRTFYYHWAVYIGKDDQEDPKVIHWWSPTYSKTSKKGTSITTTSFWETANGDEACKGNNNDDADKHIDGRIVAIRAKVKQRLFTEGITHEKYNLLFSNCQHFAKWCRYKGDNLQLDKYRSSLPTVDVSRIDDLNTRTVVLELLVKCETHYLEMREECRQLRTEIKKRPVDKLQQSIDGMQVIIALLAAFVLLLFVMVLVLFMR